VVVNTRIDWSPSDLADLQTIAEWIEQDRNLANCRQNFARGVDSKGERAGRMAGAQATHGTTQPRTVRLLASFI
jgi:plasmid stabilization system protein ParE